ncbi:MAG: DUF1330 domain-containing protein [Arenicella sp.]
MTAYILFHENIIDPEAFEEYKKISPGTIEKFGGKFIVRGGPLEELEGTVSFERVVIIEFPTKEAAKAWHNSSEYAPAKTMRQMISEGNAVLVEGF